MMEKLSDFWVSRPYIGLAITHTDGQGCTQVSYTERSSGNLIYPGLNFAAVDPGSLSIENCSLEDLEWDMGKTGLIVDRGRLGSLKIIVVTVPPSEVLPGQVTTHCISLHWREYNGSNGGGEYYYFHHDQPTQCSIIGFKRGLVECGKWPLNRPVIVGGKVREYFEALVARRDDLSASLGHCLSYLTHEGPEFEHSADYPDRLSLSKPPQSGLDDWKPGGSNQDFWDKYAHLNLPSDYYPPDDLK